MHMDERDQAVECEELRHKIEDNEARLRHARTVVLGDFNLNPWEQGMISTGGLHAVAQREVALRRARTVSGRSYAMFYNPMWRLLGDREGALPGTFYHESPSHTGFFWNMFDQVLVRPELLLRFRDESVQIVSRIGEQSLLRENGRPNSTLASDHLPIVFDLDLLEVGDGR